MTRRTSIHYSSLLLLSSLFAVGCGSSNDTPPVDLAGGVGGSSGSGGSGVGGHAGTHGGKAGTSGAAGTGAGGSGTGGHAGGSGGSSGGKSGSGGASGTSGHGGTTGGAGIGAQGGTSGGGNGGTTGGAGIGAQGGTSGGKAGMGGTGTGAQGGAAGGKAGMGGTGTGAQGGAAGGKAGMGGAGTGGAQGGTGGAQGGTAGIGGAGGTGGSTGQSSVSLSAKSIDFGLSDCGGAAPGNQTLTVTNTGSTPLTVMAAIGGSSSFGIVGMASGVIAAGQSQDFTVSSQGVPGSATAGVAVVGTLILTTSDPVAGTVNVPISITPQGATLTISPSPAAFGDVNQSQAAAPLPIVIKNTGNVGVAVALGAPSDAQFTLSSTGGQLDAAATIPNLTAGFTPTGTGPASATVAVTTTGAALCGTNPATLTLTGQGVVGQITVSGDLDFGSNPCAGAAATPQKVTITNSGSGAFTFDAALTGGASSPYAVSPASASVPAGGSVDITVTPAPIPFPSPITAGAFNDTLTITTTGIPNDAPHIVNLKQSASGAVIGFDTQSIQFGNVAVQSTATSSFQLINSGNAPANVTLSVDSGKFGVTPSTPIAIAAAAAGTQQKQGATASFSPTDITPQTGNLGATVDQATVLCQPLPKPIQLSGTGQNGGVSFDTTTLDFGSVNCGGVAAAKTFTLTNSGNAPLTFSASLGKNPSPYAISPAGGSIDPGKSALITVTPGQVPQTSQVTPDLYADTITVLTNVIGDSGHAIQLHETAQGAIFAFDTGSLDFGSIPVNTTEKLGAKLINSGNLGATVSFGSSNNLFTQDPAVPTAVSASSSTPLSVTFAPGTNTQAQTGTVPVSIGASDVLCAPLPAGLALTGTGTNGSISFTPQSLDFKLVNCGSTAGAQQIVFSNNGNGDYTITGATLGLGAGSPYAVSITPANGVVSAKAGGVAGTATITITPKMIPQVSAVPGNYGDTLTVNTTDAGGNNSFPIALSEGAQGAIIAVDTTAFHFGNEAVGAQGNIQFAISNSGNAPATVDFTNSNAVFSFDNPTVQGNTTAHPLAHFVPAMAQGYADNASLTVTNTVLCQPLPANTQNNKIVLDGHGVNQSSVTIAPNNLNFGAVGCGQQAQPKTVVISNGSAGLITFMTSFNFGTSFAANPPSGSIAANSTFSIQVVPTAVPQTSTPGAGLNDTLFINTSAPNDTTHNVAIAESATGAFLNFQAINGADIQVLGVPAKPGGFANFNLRNTGTQAVSFSLSNTDNVDYSVNNLGPISLPPGQTSSDSVFFTGPNGAANLKSKLSFVQVQGPVCQSPLPALTFISQ